MMAQALSLDHSPKIRRANNVYCSCVIYEGHIWFADWDDVEHSEGQLDEISSCSEEAGELQNGDVTDDIIKEDADNE